MYYLFIIFLFTLNRIFLQEPKYIFSCTFSVNWSICAFTRSLWFDCFPKFTSLIWQTSWFNHSQSQFNHIQELIRPLITELTMKNLSFPVGKYTYEVCSVTKIEQMLVTRYKGQDEDKVVHQGNLKIRGILKTCNLTSWLFLRLTHIITNNWQFMWLS